jgi:hypothetical protein
MRGISASSNLTTEFGCSEILLCCSWPVLTGKKLDNSQKASLPSPSSTAIEALFKPYHGKDSF